MMIPNKLFYKIGEACKKLDIQYRLIPALSDVLAQEEPELVRTALLSHEGSI